MDILNICEKIESEYKPTTIELTKQELDHIINDMLDYIDNIADKCAPDKFVFYDLKKGETLTEEETAE